MRKNIGPNRRNRPEVVPPLSDPSTMERARNATGDGLCDGLRGAMCSLLCVENCWFIVRFYGFHVLAMLYCHGTLLFETSIRKAVARCDGESTFITYHSTLTRGQTFEERCKNKWWNRFMYLSDSLTPAVVPPKSLMLATVYNNYTPQPESSIFRCLNRS